MLTGIRICLGLILILFGIAKLLPVEPFEFLLVDQYIVGWFGAPILARLIVFWEVFLGLSLLLNFKIKKTLWFTFITILFFTFYLIYDLITSGNRADCGCTGTLFELSTRWSILKNLILLALLFILIKKAKSYNYKRSRWVLIGILAVSVTSVLVLAPFYQLAPPVERINKAIDLSQLPRETSQGISIDYHNEECILMFVSPSCSHCQVAMKKMEIIKAQNDMLPVYLIFYAHEGPVVDYIKENNITLPYVVFPDDALMRLVGGKIPTLFHIDHGVLEHVWVGPQFNPDEVVAQ